MDRFLNNQEVAERVLSHVENGSTDLGDVVWREPVVNYTSPDRYRMEIESVLRRTATPFCPSVALPETGSYIARTAAGTPLLAVRDEEGQARVFRNACRHRGTEVAQGTGCSRSFVCPYHAWTYRLSGELTHIPHEHGFPGFDKAENSLIEIPSREKHGLLFVNQEGGEADRWAGLDELPDMLGTGQRLLDSSEMLMGANWKVALEGAIEGYHIKPAHAGSFYPYGYDNLNLVERVGRNSRVTYPFKRIESLAEVPAAERDVAGLLTYVYHLFPNVLITVLSHHTNLVVLEPVGIDETRFITYTLTNRKVVSEEEDAKARRDAEFVNNTGGAEDRALVESIQRSLGSNGNEVFTFGHFESALSHFHANLHAALER